MFLRVVAPAGLVLFCLAGPAPAQVLPIPKEPPAGLDNARYVNEVRGQLEGLLQEWVNAWEQGDAEAVSRFYTDEAMVMAPDGTTARGRPAVAAYWADHRAGSRDIVVAVTHVAATNTLATARGRISYRPGPRAGPVPAVTRTGDMILVFERHRGEWMTRLHAMAHDHPSDIGPVVSLPRAIRATGQEPRTPELPQVRWRAEPFAGMLQFDDVFRTPTATVAGLGVGLEVGRAAELRVAYWQGVAGQDQDGLSGLSGEVRIYGFPDSGLRPYGLAGASRLSGSVGTGRLGGGYAAGSLVPMLGGGLALDLSERWGAQFDARTYLLADPESAPAKHWINETRTANWSFSGGVSYSTGRYREWRDPPVTAVRHEYEEQVRHDLASLLRQWLNGAHQQRIRAEELYAPAARLVTPDGRRVNGALAIAGFWAERPSIDSGSLVYEDLRASGHLATLVARIRTGQDNGVGGAPGSMLVTVFEKSRGRWAVQSQMLLGEPDGGRGR